MKLVLWSLAIAFLIEWSDGKSFILMKDRSFTIRRVDEEVDQIYGLSGCILTCEITPFCVGGLYNNLSSTCQLQKDTRRRMAYKREEQGAYDVVFGLFCDPTAGYTVKYRAWIPGYNTKAIRVTSSNYTICEQLCSEYDWCLSGDYDLDNGNTVCLLSTEDSFTITLTVSDSSSYDGYYHSQKNCYT